MVAGLILLVIIFQVQDSVFLSAGNLTNLLVQGSVFVLLGMAEVWVLILGEIDLSVGYVAGIGAVITAILAAPPHNLPWALAILVGMLATAAIGMLQGTIVIRLRLPSFVVTLAGLLGLGGRAAVPGATPGERGNHPDQQSRPPRHRPTATSAPRPDGPSPSSPSSPSAPSPSCGTGVAAAGDWWPRHWPSPC